MADRSNQFIDRQKNLWRALATLDPPCDAMLITSRPNLRYLTGFTGSNGVAVVTGSETHFLTDPRYQFQSAQEVTASKIKALKEPLLNHVATLAEKRKWRRLGIEQDHLTAGQLELLQSKSGQSRLGKRREFLSRGGEVEKLRMVKSEDEVAAIRQSVRTNSQALEQALRRMKAEMTEAELAAEIDYQMRRLGAEKTAFDTIVASGPRSALPHARPARLAIEKGALLIDMGAFENAYASDMTRTFFVGAASRQGKQIYKAVLEAQLAAIDGVRPGVKASAIDRIAREVLKRHGLEKAFMHSTGHGLGLEIHEPPRLGKKDKTKLEAGMAITVEPGAYVEGVGGVRIEDTVLVTAKGCEILTPTPKELLAL
jgi:Xaa-Pro aminopeptidase